MIPIRDVVCFPNQRIAFKVGRPISVSALEKAVGSNHLIFVATQRDASIQSPSRQQIYDVGLVARVLAAEKQDNGQYKVLIEGQQRGLIVGVERRKGCLIASVQLIPVKPDTGKPLTEMMHRVGRLVKGYLPMMGEEARAQIKVALGASSPSPQVLADTIATLLPLVSVEDKQLLLETVSPYDRLQRVAELLEAKSEGLQRSIQSKPKRQAAKARDAREGSHIFIGHGRSPIWARLQVYLQNELV